MNQLEIEKKLRLLKNNWKLINNKIQINLKFSNFISKFEDVMDENNKKIVQIAKKEGTQSAVNGMFTGDKGEKLTYSEMRSRYG